MTDVLLALELGALVLVTWPLLRVAASRAARRSFSRVSILLICAVLLGFAAVAGLARWSPALMHPLALLALIGFASATWRGRDSHGRSRRVPPGSLALSTSLEAIVDRTWYLRQADRLGPVFKTAQFHQPVICVVGLARGHRLLQDHHVSLGPSVLSLNRDVTGGFLRYMEDGAHARYGPLFRQALGGPVMEDARSATREAVSRELARAADSGDDRSGRIAIAPDPILARIVFISFLRALFGVCTEDPAFETLEDAYRPLGRYPLKASLNASQRASLIEMRQLLAGLSEAQRAGQVRRSTLSELTRLDAAMPDDVCLDNLILILKIASGNVIGLLRWMLVILGRHPEWIARLRDETRDAGSHGHPDLAARIVMETLRLAQSEYLYRRLRQDVEFDGFHLPAGWLVRLCVWESHRSPESFSQPERFNPDRFLDCGYPLSVYSPFGTGPHACNGVSLTNLVSTIFIERLTRDWDWSVEGHDPPVRRLRHWDHWRPNPRYRLLLRPTSD